MEYQVPQFIEVEDKIFGPLTLRQFIYLAGGGGLVVIAILYLPLFIGVLVSIPIAGLSISLAFVKINGKNFVQLLESGFNFYIGKRLYLWKKEKEQKAGAVATPTVAAPPVAPKEGLSRRKLEELALSLDIKTGEETGTRP